MNAPPTHQVTKAAREAATWFVPCSYPNAPRDTVPFRTERRPSGQSKDLRPRREDLQVQPRTPPHRRFPERAGKRQTLQEIGEAVHAAWPTVRDWANGAHSPDGLEIVESLARHLGVPVEHLLEEEETMEHVQLSDLQLKALARVSRQIARFFGLLELTDCLVWSEYDLRGLPASLAEDIIPTALNPAEPETPESMRYGESGIRGDSLCIQATDRIWRALREEQPLLMDTPAYDDLAEFVSEHIDRYPLDEEGEWLLDPDLLFEPPYGDGRELSPITERIERAQEAHRRLLMRYAPRRDN